MHQDQQEQRRPVDEARVHLEEPVVERGDHQQQDEPQDHRDDLLVDPVERVEPVLAEGLVRGRVDQEQPDHDERGRDEQQHRVQVADRPAFLGERASRDEVHQSCDPPLTGPLTSSP